MLSIIKKLSHYHTIRRAVFSEPLDSDLFYIETSSVAPANVATRPVSKIRRLDTSYIFNVPVPYSSHISKL
jgi:hypothetical protein